MRTEQRANEKRKNSIIPWQRMGNGGEERNDDRAVYLQQCKQMAVELIEPKGKQWLDVSMIRHVVCEYRDSFDFHEA